MQSILLVLATWLVWMGQGAAHAGVERISAFDREVAVRRERLRELARRPRAPEAVVPLLGLSSLWEMVADRDALIALIDEASTRPLAPTVRAYLLLARADVLRRLGDEEGAERLSAELGIVRGFRIIGPFDNDGRRGHDKVYPPEEERVAGDEEYESKSQVTRARWRDVPRDVLSRDGRLHLDGLLRPEHFATAYAACYVRSASEVPLPIALRAGASGALKIWVNRGRPPVIDRDVYRTLRMDQEVGSAVLRPGWNRVLVKISSTDGPWSFILRLTTPDGRALTGITVSERPPAPGWVVPQALVPSVPAQNLLDELRRAARTAPRAARAQALTDLGTFMHHVIPTDPEKREAEALLEEAVRLAPSRSRYRLLAAARSDDNLRRLALLGGIALPLPDGAQAEIEEQARLYHELGRIYEEGQREPLAEEAYRTAARLDPTLYVAELSYAQIAASRGLVSEAQRIIDEVVQRYETVHTLRARGAMHQRRGQTEELFRVQERILSLSRDDVDAHRQMLDRARARGDLAGALGWLQRIGRLRPEALWVRRERVELLEGASRFQEALHGIDGALSILPDDAELIQLRGRLLARLGRRDEAVTAYRRSLLLKPQNPDLRAYLAHIDAGAAGAGQDLARIFRVDVAELKKKKSQVPLTGGAERDPARVLLDQTVTRVHRNGLSEVYNQRVVEILDEEGAKEYADFSIRYTPETQTVRIKAARVHKRDGEIEEIATQGEQDLSEPWYGLYYDVRAQTLRFDRLGPGDVLDIEYTVADVGRRNLLSDYFGDLHFLQEEIPRLQSRYVLVVPADMGASRPLYFNTPRQGPGWTVERSERQQGDERVIEFRAENVPKIHSEPGMPGYSEVASFVHVSTYRSWQEVALWYTGLIGEQLQPSPEISAAARAAVAGLVDDRARVRAIYNLVVKKTRYVGLEFGIHGYKPYKVSQVFTRKFGDCKDKAALLMVMLKEVGIESTMVLARTRRNGDLPEEPASLSAFDHAIVYVPKLDLYLDGTAEFSGAEELPEQDQDIMVLIVRDPRPPHLGKGHLDRTPVLPAERNTVRRRLLVKLAEDGSARVIDRMAVAGQVARKWREHYQASGAQKERYEKSWNDLFPSARVHRVEIPNVLDLDREVTIDGEVEVPAWARALAQGAGQQQGGLARAAEGRRELLLRPLGRDPDLLRSFARLSQRRHDLVLGFPWRNIEQVVVQLPPGLAPRRLPEPGQISSPFGRFRMSVSARGGKGGEIRIDAALEIHRHRIRREEYAGFRRFCAEVDRLVGQELVVGHD